jgi:hypothetical protein
MINFEITPYKVSEKVLTLKYPIKKKMLQKIQIKLVYNKLTKTVYNKLT